MTPGAGAFGRNKPARKPRKSLYLPFRHPRPCAGDPAQALGAIACEPHLPPCPSRPPAWPEPKFSGKDRVRVDRRAPRVHAYNWHGDWYM